MSVLNRYSRQIPIIGKEGQNKLEKANVLIAGVGGLGSVVATYLAAAGVGNITLLDNDIVDLSNLNRQFLHNCLDINKEKVISGFEKLSLLNPEIKINIINKNIEQININNILKKNTIVVDALDNIDARFILFDAAFKKQIPFFHGAVSGFMGQISTFLHKHTSPCLFCFLSLKKSSSSYKIPIIGVTTGVVGSIQCNEVIKYIIHKGNLIENEMLIWNGLFNSIDYLKFEKDLNCPICGTNKK